MTAGKRTLTALALIAVAAIGIALIVQGARPAAREAHPQPLPSEPFRIDPQQATALPDAEPTESCEAPSATPSTVRIPSLCITASLVPTAFSGGELTVPRQVDTVGFDRASAALDAQEGTTVIAGHVDDVRQGDGAFHELSRARAGADVLITDAHGATWSWKVYSVTSVRKAALPQSIFLAPGGERDAAGLPGRALVLVTCGGALMGPIGNRYYADNVLVYAVPADPAQQASS